MRIKIEEEHSMEEGRSMERLSGKQTAVRICLLFVVGILFLIRPMAVQAAENDLTSELTGGTDLEPGETVTAEDLNDENSSFLSITMNNSNGELSSSLKMLITLTLIALIPTILLLMTSYTRILIVLHFTRAALNTQTAPPNQTLIGLALILTFFIMSPTIEQIYEEAYVPFEAGEIEQEEALEKAMDPLRTFMYRQTKKRDVELFMDIANQEWDGSLASISMSVLIPSFVIGELRTAFIIGFVIYIPFIVIDMVVASTLMSMGMMMLPPTTISMPFKILLFVLADGWGLIIGNVVKTFY